MGRYAAPRLGLASLVGGVLVLGMTSPSRGLVVLLTVTWSLPAVACGYRAATADGGRLFSAAVAGLLVAAVVGLWRAASAFPTW